MKIQTRLSLYSSLIFGVIFAVISVLIYSAYFSSTKQSIDSNLAKTAQLVALFYLEEDELSNDEFAKIRTQFEELVSASNYEIYNEHDSIYYGSYTSNISPEILNRIREKGKLSFNSDEHLYHGIYYEDNQGNFVVIANEKKNVLNDNLNTLLGILILAFIIGMLSIIFLSKWIANIAYRPFREAIDQVQNISTNNLDVQIKLPDTHDELEDLIRTFNELLEKISETFTIQKNFVSYVSHEFKTPLAAMQGNLEVFSIKDRSPEEYRHLCEKLIEEINQLESIINTLIIVSDLRGNSEITSQLRVDELIWEIIAKLSESHTGSKIYVNIEIEPEDEALLTIAIDRTQLLMALFNIIENAVKYSKDKTVDIRIFKQNGKLFISIADKGIGIPATQLNNINKPFYRADNTNQIQGSGIGLSIALRILEKNNISYQINSQINKGTEIILNF